MNGRNTVDRYATWSVALHWLMLLLLAAVYACIELRVLYPKGSDPREAMKTWHFMLGLLVFALVWLRLVLRLRSPAPPITPEPARWQRAAATLMHAALYVFMIGMPLAGWLLLSADGKPIPFFGLELPALIGENKELARSIKDWHETGGTVGYYLVGLHALAGLYHHYFVRDDSLRRMLPRGR